MLQIQNNPWLGLASYQEKDAELFFGRKREIALLCEVIKQNYSTVIYGKSGMGKTSLINAGLIPMLSNDGFLPVSIKLEHNSSHSYTQQIIEAVTCKLEEHGCEVENDARLDAIMPDEYRLWSFFHTNIFWSKDNYRIIPVVFIDQFEEIFTICESKNDVLGFFALFNDLFQPLPPDEALKLIEDNNIRIDFNETTNFRLILSLREDFLARLEDYSYNIPFLKKNRVGVSPMNGLQALEVVLKPIPDIMDRRAALKILEKVSKCPHIKDDEEVLEDLSIETCILSLFCSQLYKKAVELKRDTITSEMIEQFGDNIINDYYHECMKKVSKDSVTFLEDKLLTSSGYRNSLAYEDVVPKYVLKSEIDHLEKCRLVRIELLNKTERIEFTHDVLCGVALEHKTRRRQGHERKGKVMAVLSHLAEFLLMLAFLVMLFWTGRDPFRGIMNSEELIVYFVGAVFLLPLSMLMRLAVYTTDRRSVLYSIVMFILSNAGGILACGLMDGLRCKEEYYIWWALVYFFYIFIIFIVSFTKSRPGSLAKLGKTALLIKDTSILTSVSLRIFVPVCYLLLAAVSGIYMRAPLTVAMMVGIVPVVLLVASIWKSGLLKNMQVWLCGLVMLLLSVGLYASQFAHFRLPAYLCAALLLVATYWGVSVIATVKHGWRKVPMAIAAWAVCFIALPVFIMGYNFWALGDYAFVKDGLIVTVYDDIVLHDKGPDKVDSRYVVLKNRKGQQGAFDRELHVLVPPEHRRMGTEAIYKYGDHWYSGDVRFSINDGDSAFISEYLAYENQFSKPLVKAYTATVQTSFHDRIRKVCTRTSSGSGNESASRSGEGLGDLNGLCDEEVALGSLDPDVYRKMAKYYHVKDSAAQELAMLAKALQYTVAMDSTVRFLAKGNWNAEKHYVLSSLASAVVYVETGHWYSNYVDKYDSCFYADKPYQQFVKTFMADVKPQTFLSEIVDDWKYDLFVANALSNQPEYLSLRNPHFNLQMKKVYNRLGEWLSYLLVNKSYALLLMGEYGEAKETALAAMDGVSKETVPLASTNLVGAHLFLGEYEEACKLLETYNDSVIYNGVFHFYRDCILQDLDVFERMGITDDMPDDTYRKIRAFIDPADERNYVNVGRCSQYGDVYWATTKLETGLPSWWFPFGLGQEGSVCLLDKHGNRISPMFDDVYAAHYRWDFENVTWLFDPIVIYNLNGKRGYYDVSTRRFITDAEFDHAWIFSEGLAAVAKNGKVGFIDQTGKVVIPFRFEYVPYRDYVFEDGFAYIPDRFGGAEIINKQGEVVNTLFP